VQEYYKITLKEKREYHQRQDMADPGYETIYLEGQYKKDLNEKIESLSKKLGYKYTAIFYKVLDIVNEEVAAYRKLDQINAELNREFPLKASPQVIIVDGRSSRNPKAGKTVNIKIDDLKKQTEKDPSKEQELTALVDKHNALLEKARAQEQEIRNLWLQL